MIEVWENLDLNDLDGEIWKDIEEFGRDYQISNFGRVKSFLEHNGTDVRILEQYGNSKGYFSVGLYINGKVKHKQIHTLMFESFNNYKLKKNECIHHIDFTKDNYLENIQVMTKGEHQRLHMENISEETRKLMSEHTDNKGEKNPMYGKHLSEKARQLMREQKIGKYLGENNPMYGSKRPGEKSGHHILTEQDVLDIRIDLEEGLLTQKKIAEKFGVTPSAISNIKLGRSWDHIK